MSVARFSRCVRSDLDSSLESRLGLYELRVAVHQVSHSHGTGCNMSMQALCTSTGGRSTVILSLNNNYFWNEMKQLEAFG